MKRWNLADGEGSPGLADVAILGGLMGPSLAVVLGCLEEQAFPAGAPIFRQGEPARALYIVEQGEIELVHRRRMASGERLLRVASCGGSFGEESLLDLQPRWLTARARTGTRLRALRYADLLRVQTADPHAFTLLIMNIAREVSRRLRQANQLIVQAGPARRSRADARRSWSQAALQLDLGVGSLH